MDWVAKKLDVDVGDRRRPRRCIFARNERSALDVLLAQVAPVLYLDTTATTLIDLLRKDENQTYHHSHEGVRSTCHLSRIELDGSSSTWS